VDYERRVRSRVQSSARSTQRELPHPQKSCLANHPPPESEQQSTSVPRRRLEDSEAESLRTAFRRSKVADAFNHDVIQRIGEIISRAMGIRP